MAQRIRPQSRGGGGTSDAAAAAAAAPSTSKRKRVLQDISEEHSCVGVSTRQQSSSVSSSRRSQQAPRRPSPMAPRRSNRNSRRVNAHQAAASTTKTRSSSGSGSSNASSGSGRRTRSSSSVPRGANTTGGGSGRAAAVSCKQEEAEGEEEEADKDDDDDEGSMSCDEDLEGMVVDLSFEGVADDGEAEPPAPQRRRRSSTAGAGRCVGGEGAGGKSTCGEGGGGGGDPAAAAAAAAATAAAEGGGCADSRRRSKDGSSCSSQPPARPAAAAAQQRVGGARKPHAQQQQQQQQQQQLPPGVKDIDAGVSEEGESHLLNPDYAKEHALYLREQEKRNRPVAYIGAKQKDMRPSMRSVLVDWICEVCDQFKLSSRTLFQAVDLIDRSLSAFEVPRGKLQLLGCACVVLASKYEEIYAPTAEELAHISDNTYTRAEIIAMELVVVNALQFRLTCITPCNFQDRFCLAAKSNARERSLVSYLLELLLQDYQGVSLLPSLKAAAALYLARQTLHPRGCPREAWTRQTEHYTGYAAGELEPCVRRLHYLHVRAEGNNLHAVRDKYKKSALHRVAEVTCALEDYLHFGEEGDVRQ